MLCVCILTLKTHFLSVQINSSGSVDLMLLIQSDTIHLILQFQVFSPSKALLSKITVARRKVNKLSFLCC